MSDFQLAMAVLGLVTVVFGLAFWGQRRRVGVGRPKERIDVVDDRLTALEGDNRTIKHDVANIRASIGALPSKDAVHRLEVELAALKGDIKLGNAETLATSRAVERIENHLLAVAAAKDLKDRA